MGVLFEHEDKLLWDPSPRVAQLFVSQVRAAEQLLDEPSGISDVVADEVAVNKELLPAFIASGANALELSGSAALRGMLAPCLGICAGLLAAIDEASNVALIREDPWVEWGRAAVSGKRTIKEPW